MFDTDDLPVIQPKPLFSTEQWYVFRVTWPSQVFWLLIYGLIALIFYSTIARAQIAIHPSPPSMPVCVEKADAYKLALADMQGTLPALWSEFVHEGRCCFMPATYLYTIDTYRDDTHAPSRVVELLAYGERVWGLRSNLPKTGVWMI